MECVGRHFCSRVIGDTCFPEPVHRALAGVHLHGEGDDGEEGEHRVEDDTDEHEYLSGAGTQKKKSAEDEPCNPFAGERYNRYESRTKTERTVFGSMLHGVSALVCSYCSSGYVRSVIDILGEVDGLGSRVVVVGQLARDASDLDIIDAMVMQHFLRYFFSGHAQGFLRITLELTLKGRRDQPARQSDADKDDPIYSRWCHYAFVFLIFLRHILHSP